MPSNLLACFSAGQWSVCSPAPAGEKEVGGPEPLEFHDNRGRNITLSNRSGKVSKLSLKGTNFVLYTKAIKQVQFCTKVAEHF